VAEDFHALIAIITIFLFFMYEKKSIRKSSSQEIAVRNA
jgi:hypothetical protein